MSLSILYSDDITVLANDLALKLRQQAQKNNDPFKVTKVIVPNKNVARWLSLHLAEANRVCAGVGFVFIESALWEMVASLDFSGADATQMLSAEALQQAIAAVLIRNGNSEPALFSRYCHPNGLTQKTLAEPDCARRLWQVSGRLAAYFREYEFQRDKMIEHWLGQNAGSWFPASFNLTDEQKAMESAQRVLYCELFGKNGIMANLGRPVESLRQLTRRVFAKSGNAGGAEGKAAKPAETEDVFFFGLSSVSELYAEVIHRLSEHYNLVVYHFNVCMEYWEDAQTPWERIKASKRSDDAASDEELDLVLENDLLNTWGVTGRETLKMLSELEERGVQAHVREVSINKDCSTEDSSKNTVLKIVQSSIRKRTSRLVRKPQDSSLQIMACPSRQREVETVHNAILASMLSANGIEDARHGLPKLKHKGDLKLSDIAVLVVDVPAYRPIIEAIFDARGQIPYSLVDSTASEESFYGKALLGMLRLAGSAFTRRDVFEVLRNPCFLKGIGAQSDDVAIWLEWADKLGVFHGFDKAHRKSQFMPDTSRFTWNQALARIRLGRIMDVSITNEELGPPHTDIYTASRAADMLSITIERLFRRLQKLAGLSLTCEDWKKEIELLMADFLAIPDEHAPEAYVRTKIYAALDAFGNPDALGLAAILDRAGQENSQKHSLQHKLPIAVVCQYLDDVMAAIPCGRGNYLTGGVTIASLQPMRPIPFKHVYVLGLGEGEFPGSIDRSTLDLRTIRRKLGDSNRPDANRYLFLETLVATKERFVLSYVNEDIKKDEQKFSGSIIKQLKRFVEEYVLESTQGAKEANAAFREVHVRLDEADASCTGNLTDRDMWDAGLVQTFSPYHRMIRMIRDLSGLPAKESKAWQELRERYTENPAQAGDHAGADAKKHKPLCDRVDTRIKNLLERVMPSEQPSAPPTPGQGQHASATASISISVKIKDLAKFLQNPAEAILLRRLKLYDRDAENPEMQEHEPVSTDNLQLYDFVIKALNALVWTPGDYAETRLPAAERAFKQAYEDEQRRSLAPEGVFGDIDREQKQAEIKTKLGKSEGLKELLGRYEQPKMIVLGKERAQDLLPNQDTVRLGPCKIGPVAGYESMMLAGVLPCLFESNNGQPPLALVLTNARYESAPVPSKHLLEPFLAMLCLRAQGSRIGSDNDFVIAVLYKNQDALILKNFTYKGITPEIAQSYLADLASNYFNADSISQLLPYEVFMSIEAGSMLQEILGQIRGVTEKSDLLDVEKSPLDDNKLAEILGHSIEDAQAKSEYGFVHKTQDVVELVYDQLSIPEKVGQVIWRRFALPWSFSTDPRAKGARKFSQSDESTILAQPSGSADQPAADDIAAFVASKSAKPKKPRPRKTKNSSEENP